MNKISGMTNIEQTKTGASSEAEGVSVLSDTSDKLKEGFRQTMLRAAEMKKRWLAKKAAAPCKYRCDGCFKELGSLAGWKKHVAAKSKKCNEEMGYSIISSAVIAPEDRMTESDKKNSDILKRSRDAAILAREKIMGNNIGVINAVVLMATPMGILDNRLKKATVEVLQEFIGMKFHPMNASKKIMATTELESRLRKA